MTRRRLVVVFAVASLVAFAWPIQEPGWTQKAHYALVRALADGTPRIDAYHKETGDKSYWEGHFYSVKAPGLAAVSLPFYVVLDSVGAVPDDPRNAIWLLNLLTVVPFAFLAWIVILRLAPGAAGRRGWAAAAALAAASMVLPFAGLYFSHVPTAALAAVAVLLALEARRTGAVVPSALAGLAAGATILFEYPTAILCLALAVYLVLAGARPMRTLPAYAAGVAAGVAPLIAYNVWAFGSPTHLSYEHAVIVPGDTGHDVVGAHAKGVFGITWPSLRAFTELLVSERGLLTTTPIAALAAAGLVLLFRSGRRSTALLLAGTFAAALVYNAGLTTTFGGPFGGDSPGPRYLVAFLPLLLVGLTPMVRRAPGATAVLLVVSAGFMAVVTATQPQLGGDQTHLWWDDLVDGVFTRTPLTLAGAGTGWLSILPFFVAVAVATVVGWILSAQPLRTMDMLGVVPALAGWAVVAWACPSLLRSPGGLSGALLALLMLAVAVAAVAATARLRPARPRGAAGAAS